MLINLHNLCAIQNLATVSTMIFIAIKWNGRQVIIKNYFYFIFIATFFSSTNTKYNNHENGDWESYITFLHLNSFLYNIFCVYNLFFYLVFLYVDKIVFSVDDVETGTVKAGDLFYQIIKN